jgi:hypothetical protein
MTKLGTVVRMLVASGALVVGSSVGPVLASTTLTTVNADATLVVPDGAPFVAPGRLPPVTTIVWLAGPVSDLDDGPSDDQLAQIDLDEPLDAPLEDEDEAGDEPLDDGEPADDDPLDEPLDEPGPADDGQAPVAEVEPLDAPLDDTVVDQPDDDVEVLDAPRLETEVAVVPVTDPLPSAPAVTTTAPVKTTAAAPVPIKAKPVTSVRKKGVPEDRVVVVAGRRPLPAELATCDVAVGSGRTTVGSDCEPTSVIAAHQPAIPRVPGSSALISTDNPSLITSRRDGIQIGTFPEPTLGDSIATTVRAAIFPEDVVVPDILIVPGEVVVAGNRSREDPIVVWRSELEEASATSGIPIEMLATVITMTVHGELDPDLADGRVGPMQVPVAELAARGISEDQWTDPATNIRVGAELLATGSSAADLQSGAAVTSYLAGSCGPGDTCNQPDGTTVNELIVHYRLRATSAQEAAQAPANQVGQSSGWPFDDNEPAPPDPFARLRGHDEEDADRRRDRPNVQVGRPNDDPNSNWPWPDRTEE